MIRSFSTLAAACCLFLSAGCANLPKNTANTLQPKPLAFADAATGGMPLRMAGPFLGDRKTALTGRTILVKSVKDLALQKGEVVLTFDDGPSPKYTDRILDTLDTNGVKATFLMVGSMARAYPSMVRKVAARGHTIGSHTQHHADLAKLSTEKALGEIREGQESIAAALTPMRVQAAPFFRFPYLSDTKALRHALAAGGTVVIDADVDSKDYFVSTPDEVASRSIARLDERGSGIILFHDIHGRTAAMLPEFLAGLKRRGYTVVNIVPSNSHQSLQNLLIGAGT
jgi:peptidoglycan/xylan/chitin deacetylase (PgdA/CDA1 family)